MSTILVKSQSTELSLVDCAVALLVLPQYLVTMKVKGIFLHRQIPQRMGQECAFSTETVYDANKHGKKGERTKSSCGSHQEK